MDPNVQAVVDQMMLQIQQLQADVVAAQAAAQAAQQQQAPQVVVAPQAGVPTNAPGQVGGILDYDSATGIKLWKSGSAPLGGTLFDGTQDKTRTFINDITTRSVEHGWGIPLFTIDCDGTNRELLEQYGMITYEQVLAHVDAYRPNAAAVTRGTQCAQQLHHMLQASLDPTLKSRLIARREEYLHHGHEDGVLMLKILLSLVNVETRATLAVIQRNLAKLPDKMVEFDFDILKFNQWVKDLITQLTVRNQVIPSLVASLFDAYKMVPDDTFNTYILHSESEWEKPTTPMLSNEEVLELAETKYHTQLQKGEWKAVSAKDEHIIALIAKVERLASLAALKSTQSHATGSTSKTKKKERNAAGDTSWAWKLVAPGPNDPQRKKFQDKWYIYCPHHKSTKWVLEENHVNGCRNAPVPEPNPNEPSNNAPTTAQLNYARALMTVMGNDDENEGEGNQEE